MNNFSDSDIGKCFNWEEVKQVHKVRNGIYQRNGKLISLLTDFGKINPCYPDFEGENPDTLFYTGAGRRGNQKLDVYNQAMKQAISTQAEVPLFCKKAVNEWEFLGYWRVIDAEYVYEEKNKRMIWSFVLKRVQGS